MFAKAGTYWKSSREIKVGITLVTIIGALYVTLAIIYNFIGESQFSLAYGACMNNEMPINRSS